MLQSCFKNSNENYLKKKILLTKAYLHVKENESVSSGGKGSSVFG